MDRPAFVHVAYIATTPEKLWEALTDGEFTRRYWGGGRIGIQARLSDTSGKMAASIGRGNYYNRSGLDCSPTSSTCRSATSTVANGPLGLPLNFSRWAPS